MCNVLPYASGIITPFSIKLISLKNTNKHFPISFFLFLFSSCQKSSAPFMLEQQQLSDFPPDLTQVFHFVVYNHSNVLNTFLYSCLNASHGGKGNAVLNLSS